MNTTRQVLTIKQVAEFLQVSTDTVYRLATSGELRGRKIGRIWRFPKDAIQEYLRDESNLRNDSFISCSNESSAGDSGDYSSTAKPSRSIEPAGRVNQTGQSVMESSNDSSL